METHRHTSNVAQTPPPTQHKLELWGLMHARAALLRDRLDLLHKEKSDPVLVAMWRDLVHGLHELLATILGRQAVLGPSGWDQEMQRVISEKKIPEERVMLVMAHTLVAMERALRRKGN